MQTSLGEARGMREEPGHGVARTSRIDTSLPQHHVAAAFAMHGPAGRELPEPNLAACGAGALVGRQLRIATRKPTGVAMFRGRLIGEGREGHDFCAGATPAAQYVRIDECKGGVRGERDTLPRRRQGSSRVRLDTETRGEGLNSSNIAMVLREIGETVQAKF